MPGIPKDLFLLMLNLSQLDSEEVIKDLFLEAISDWTKDRSVRFGSQFENSGRFSVNISTASAFFGKLLFSSDELGEDEIAIISNAANTLAVILDSLRNKRIMEQEKRELEEKIRKRTVELKKINEELMAEIMERELYEQQLVENEARFRELVENINDVLFTMDKTGIITYISPVIGRMGGYSPEEIIGRPCTLFIHPDDRTKIEKAIHSDPSIGVLVSRFRGMTRNGRTRWLRSSVRAIMADGSISGFRGILTDMTDLKEKDDRFEIIARNIDEVLWFIDVEENSLAYISPSYENVWGYSSSDLYADLGAFINTVHPDDRDKIRQGLKDVKATGLYDDECRILRPDGETRWMWVKIFPLRNGEGEIINMIGLARDITDKKRNELRYSAIIQTSLVGFLLVDKTGEILEVNEAVCSMTGYSKADLTGKKVSSIEARYNLNAVLGILEQVSKAGGSRFESRLKRSDDRLIDVDICINSLPTEDGRFVVFIRDVTDRKQLEEQVIRAQKMESIGRLAAGIAHDFNNLLSPILGYTEMMMLASKSKGEEQPMLDEIRKAAERSKELVRQLMTFSRKQVIELKSTSFSSIVGDFGKILRRTLRENIEIEIVHDEQAGTIVADTGKIEQIIMNLVVNAQDAMPDGGILKIETGATVLDGSEPHVVPNLAPGRYAYLSVSDNGCGMDEETRSRIFDPFYTTKEDGKGTGLGLATVYGIASQHDGGVAVMSSPFKGSTFVIYIPVRTGSSQYDEKDGAECSSPAEKASDSTVMIVEDEEMTRTVVSSILTTLGYTTVCASSGEECFAMLEDPGLASSINLLLADVVMPDIIGPDLFKRVREKHPGIKAVFMSGYPMESMNSMGISRDDYDFLQKPFSVKDLGFAIEKVLKLRT